MKLQVSSPILINFKKGNVNGNDDNMVQTLSVYYGIGVELPSSELELELP